MRPAKPRTPPTSTHRTIYAHNDLWDALDKRAAAVKMSRSEFAERILFLYLHTTHEELDIKLRDP